MNDALDMLDSFFNPSDPEVNETMLIKPQIASSFQNLAISTCKSRR